MMMLNPNCSEMVCKLPVTTMEEARDKLKEIGIETVNIPWYMNFSDDITNDFLLDKDNPNSPDFVNSAIISLEEDFEGQGIFIVGHQHCQHQLYATIQKIEKNLDTEFDGYDGGYNFKQEYKAWKKKRKAVGNYQKHLRKLVGVLLADESFKRLLDSEFQTDFYAPRYQMKKKVAEQEQLKDEAKQAVAAWIADKKELVEQRMKEHPKDWTEDDKKRVTTPSGEREKYIALHAMISKVMLPYKEEMVLEQDNEFKGSWMATVTNSQNEPLTEERKQSYYTYYVERIAKTVYVLMNNRAVREAFLDEKWAAVL